MIDTVLLVSSLFAATIAIGDNYPDDVMYKGPTGPSNPCGPLQRMFYPRQCPSLQINRNYNWNNYPEGFNDAPSQVRSPWGSNSRSGYGGTWNQQQTYSRANPCTPWMRLMGRCPVQQSWYYPNYDPSIYNGAR